VNFLFEPNEKQNLRFKDGFVLLFALPSNGLRYLRVGGRGFCLGAGKTRSQKNLENAAESHTSGARFVGRCYG